MLLQNNDQQPTDNCDCDRNKHGSKLYIAYQDLKPGDTTDMSKRPLAAGTRIWNSPAITFSPADKSGNAQAGVPTTISARINNCGKVDAFDVYVEFWWFNPAPVLSNPSPGQLIGTTIVTITPDTYRIVECPEKWIPSTVDFGHKCLVVQCRSSSEGKDDLKFPFDAFSDRHVGQHNLTISPPQQLKMLRLTVANPFSSAERFAIRLQTLFINSARNEFRAHPMRELAVQLANLAPGEDMAFIGNRRVPLEVMEVTQHEFGIRITGTRKIRRVPQKKLEYARYKEQPGENLGEYIRVRAMADPDFYPGTPERVLAELLLEPGEAHEADIDLSQINVKTGCFLVHHFTQLVAGYEMGGYTVVVPPPGG